MNRIAFGMRFAVQISAQSFHMYKKYNTREKRRARSRFGARGAKRARLNCAPSAVVLSLGALGCDPRRLRDDPFVVPAQENREIIHKG